MVLDYLRAARDHRNPGQLDYPLALFFPLPLKARQQTDLREFSYQLANATSTGTAAR
jgi:hypothetical protein